MAVAHGDSEFFPAYSRALVATTEAISANRDPDALLRNLACRLRKLINLLTLQVTLYDVEGGATLLRLIDPPDAGPDVEDPPNDSPTRIVWREQRPLMVSATSDGARFPKYVAWMHELGLQSEYVLPVSSAESRLGAIGFGSGSGHLSGESERHWLQLIAKEFSVAIDDTSNLREARWNRQELARQRDRFRLLLEINNALVSDPNL